MPTTLHQVFPYTTALLSDWVYILGPSLLMGLLLLVVAIFHHFSK